MKISKCSLRTLPVMLLLEMLSPALMLAVLLAAYFVKKLGGEPAAAAVAILAGMAVMGVWILCTVLLYGIMELSNFFAYAWYLHLTDTPFMTLIRVTDDGTGRNTMTEKQKNRQSVGIKNVRERLKTLCGGELIFESSDAGTTVTITIPKSDTMQS